MRARESWCAECFLSFVSRFPSWHTQHKSCLIPSGGCWRDAVSTVPPPVDAFTWIQEVQLHNLKTEASENELRCSDAVQTLFDWVRVRGTWNITYLVWKSCIAWHHHAPATTCCSHRCDIETLSPLLVNPLEWKWVTHFVGLLCIWSSWKCDKYNVRLNWREINLKINCLNWFWTLKPYEKLGGQYQLHPYNGNPDTFLQHPKSKSLSRTFGHYDQRAPIVGTSNCTNIVVLLPLLHNPLLKNNKHCQLHII